MTESQKSTVKAQKDIYINKVLQTVVSSTPAELYENPKEEIS